MGGVAGKHASPKGTAMRRRGTLVLLSFLGILFLAAGCGGGGESGPSQAPAPTAGTFLSWDPPARFSDNIPLEPREDLDHYELYLKEQPVFREEDQPVAILAAVEETVSPDGTTRTTVPAQEFFLGHLAPFVGTGKRYYVSLRAVGIDGQRSGFMSPVAWEAI